MLGRGHHPVLLDAPDEGRADAPDKPGVLADGPGVDDRVVRVDVDVDDRGVGHVDAHGPALERRDPAHFVGQLLGARGPERHERREEGRVRDLVARPSLEVRGHEERDAGQLLEIVGQAGRLVDLPAEQDEPADPAADDEVVELGQVIAVAVPELPGKAAGHELADLFLDGHPSEGPFDPPGLGSWRDLLRYGRGPAGAARCENDHQRGEEINKPVEPGLHVRSAPGHGPPLRGGPWRCSPCRAGTTARRPRRSRRPRRRAS